MTLLHTVNTVNIAIIGAGVIGLSQALFLLKKGLSVAIIDKVADKILEGSPAIFDARVFALTPQTVIFLQELGIWDNMLETRRVCPYYHMRVWDGKGSGKIDFDASSLGVSELGYIVEQNILLHALLKQVKMYLDGGQLVWHVQEPIELLRDKPDQIGVKLANHFIIYANLLIGADGANSRLRSLASLSIRVKEYHQTAIVATVQTQEKHAYTAYQKFSEGGPLALLPLFDKNKVSIVWTRPTEISEQLLLLSDAEFNQQLTQFSEKILGELAVVGNRKSFVLKTQQAQSYGSDRVVLIGDSAHVIHPLAGLGANLGFQDVLALSRLILKQSKNKRDLGSNSLIQRYYRERIAKTEAVRHSMTVLNTVFTHQNSLVNMLRNWGIDKVNSRPFLKQWFAKQAMGLEQWPLL